MIKSRFYNIDYWFFELTVFSELFEPIHKTNQMILWINVFNYLIQLIHKKKQSELFIHCLLLTNSYFESDSFNESFELIHKMSVIDFFLQFDSFESDVFDKSIKPVHKTLFCSLIVNKLLFESDAFNKSIETIHKSYQNVSNVQCLLLKNTFFESVPVNRQSWFTKPMNDSFTSCC